MPGASGSSCSKYRSTGSGPVRSTVRSAAQSATGPPRIGSSSRPPRAAQSMSNQCAYREPAPVGQHRPELAVERLRRADAHVVGHHVHHHAQAVTAERGDHGPEPVLAAQVVADPRMVHHVVAVHRARRGLQDRRQVDVGHAQRGQVARDGGRGREPELAVQLQPVGGAGPVRHGAGAGPGASGCRRRWCRRAGGAVGPRLLRPPGRPRCRASGSTARHSGRAGWRT